MVEPVVNANEISRIAVGASIKGDLSSHTDIRVDGNVNGVLYSEGRIVGLITFKDITKEQINPNACKDSKGRLRVAAGIGITADALERVSALVAEGVDAVVLDSAHGHTKGVIDKLKEITNGKKIIALSENGPIPDIQREVNDDAVWSWWMPWYNTWNGNYVYKTSNAEWKSCMSNPCVITLDDLSAGWEAQTSITQHPAPNTQHPAPIYSISGQCIASATHSGIYIVNGKKMLIK